MRSKPQTWVPVGLMIFDCLASSRRHRPNADPHAKSTNIRPFIETDLDKASVSSQDIAELVHRGPPTETTVDMIQYRRRVGFTDLFKEGQDLQTEALCTAHSSLTSNAALQGTEGDADGFGFWVGPGACKRLPTEVVA